MKLNKILQLAKGTQRVEIIDTPAVQWVKVRGSSYPLSGYPRLRTREEVLTMFGAAPKDFEEWDVSFVTGDDYFEISRTEADDDNMITMEDFGLILGGEAYAVYDTPSGVALVGRAFFLPPDRVQTVVDAHKHVRLMDGMFCVGVIEKHMFTPAELEELARLRRLMARLAGEKEEEE